MRKTKSRSKAAKKWSLRKKPAAPASTRKARLKKTARRATRKGYDAQMGRPTGRDATALARLDERTKEHITGGMDETAGQGRDARQL